MCAGCYGRQSNDELYKALTPEGATKRVDRGFEFLNENYPEDWVYEIDLSTLDISHAYHCIGGQLEDRFCQFQDKWGLWGEEVVSLGLDTFGANSGDAILLTQAWVRKIEAQKELMEA
jgi:hypothetical protein